ncbi:hypothetical protein RJ639_006413 [Escallonia herrerae]|uniref:Cyclin-like domain-containing protein n=1 Tax=Escallonia herrerae TaxID=1293975 RepID=A0AA88W0I8_9ASTE|nr:hypothetical protein RJ639_006413 [Escallonia herrerae]
MAANFWNSTHHKQLLDPEEADVVHPIDKEKGFILEDFKLIKMHMANYIARLAQNVKVRQRVVATAVTYMRRVYTRKSMTEYDPRLVAPSCLYLASKAEESTVQARLLVFYIKKLYSDEKYRLLQDAGMSDSTQLACVLKEKENTAWFEELRVDMNVVKNIAMEILDFYDSHKAITDDRVNAAMHKLGLKA